MPIDKENLELWASLRARAALRLPRATMPESTFVPAGTLWTGFVRGGYCCSADDLGRETELNIFRRSDARSKDRPPTSIFTAHTEPQPNPPIWQELSALASRKAAPDVEEGMGKDNAWPAHLVAGGVEALIVGAPGVRRWRLMRGKTKV